MKPRIEVQTVRFLHDDVEYVADVEVVKYNDREYGKDRDGGRSMSRVFIDEATVVSIKSDGKEVQRTTELCEVALDQI